MSIAPTEAPELVLNASHRCDACGSSRAYVLAIITCGTDYGELYFCRHDWQKHKDAIRPLLAALVDETAQLDKHIEDDKGVR
jgi:hypothetical protein